MVATPAKLPLSKRLTRTLYQEDGKTLKPQSLVALGFLKIISLWGILINLVTAVFIGLPFNVISIYAHGMLFYLIKYEFSDILRSWRMGIKGVSGSPR